MIANFVMEMGLESDLATYSGGLGILAGDLAFSMADLGVPAVFVTLLYRKGYANQKLDREKGQLDFEAPFDPATFLTPLKTEVEVEIAGNVQGVKAWERRIRGRVEVPVIFLDTEVPGNDEATAGISDRLYGGDGWHRLLQEMVLGIGGYRMLKALGYGVDTYHLNESHAAFLTVELTREFKDIKQVRKRCVFTVHTPVPAGFDAFPVSLVQQAFAKYDWVDWDAEVADGVIDLARLALKYSGAVNAVSLKHRYTSQKILRYADIRYVTNGVYHRRWIHGELKKLYDRHIPGWEETPSLMGGAFGLPLDELAASHSKAKSELLRRLEGVGGTDFTMDALTIGLAKRATAYKRNNFLLVDPERLIDIARKGGPIQLVLAGKAHPRDDIAKGMIREIMSKSELIRSRTDSVRIVFLENYDIAMAQQLVAGCDLWLNHPRRHLEASGTSGMKAAMNGVPNFSVYDGWWLEGGIEGVNGWGIGKRAPWADLSEGSDPEDLEDMYTKLSTVILPTFYHVREKWLEIARSSIATVGPLFNSYRMVEDYLARVYSFCQPAGHGFA